MSYLPCVEIEPPQPAETSVIWLHGLGASGHDFEPVVPELARKSTRFVFPHAPQIPVTVNGGMVMPAWYDIISLGGGGPIDEDGIRRSAARIDALIEREIERGIPAERIVVAGFSQGGAVAYEVALRHPARLAGLMALSTYFATADSIQCSDANQALPIFIAHGTFDPMVPEEGGRRAAETLTAKGYSTDYKTYPMEHAVCLEEIQDIAAFLHSVLD
ncbi:MULTISPECIES: alpha/beta hydrolase [Alcanivoracaceae]|jgi:phospholipase/carboxylesterase|uniref:Alpha/beta hydrolase n=1 Tax=Alloalcanivorax xenomutans TaxID=1094342 RepID=A0A9Q3W4Q2_9GAMM|nr:MULTISPECIES: alpha/beta fold hydrolase [Alcanivoracaceae]MBA4722262.1 alpha/beta fold hydrolase [Alcanivorax sp.]ARB44937.1 carboxylesterase [Alloalcanivorax xenomutans]MCE7508959.1 alpha/beta hydrolase [Alloalcanivorax xenomutans]MCE7522264.1 alpha/beta hydrolase [Alloalcanivorax xenomutans]PHS66783.1 MAG: carboxylesterase [Alcanivorax sp.]